VISYHPVQDGLIPGSSRTKVQYVNPGEIQDSPVEQRSGLADLPAATAGVVGTPSSHAQGIANASQFATDPASSSIPPPQASIAQPEIDFTPDSELELLFDPSLIPASMRQGLSAAYHVSIELSPLTLKEWRIYIVQVHSLTSGPASSIHRSSSKSFRPPLEPYQFSRTSSLHLLLAVQLPQINPRDVLYRSDHLQRDGRTRRFGDALC
jgi:hypothetical protein